MHRTSLVYPQNITLYQVDDQIYGPKDIATTNLFNTFLDALDGVSEPDLSWASYFVPLVT
jgi:hypothetical protein